MFDGSSGAGKSSGSQPLVSRELVIEKLKAIKLHKAQAVPKISWSKTKENFSLCGEIDYVRQWNKLAGAKGGHLVQRVTRSFEVYQWDAGNGGWKSAPMSPAEIDNLVESHSAAFATVSQYWEAWEVDDQGDTDSADGFVLCSIVPEIDEDKAPYTTKGKFVMTGDVAYFADLSAQEMGQLGFSVAEDHPANGLLATDSDPGLDITGDASHASFTLTVTWDSGDPNPDHAETKYTEAMS
jgi:hypothetical protein